MDIDHSWENIKTYLKEWDIAIFPNILEKTPSTITTSWPRPDPIGFLQLAKKLNIDIIYLQYIYFPSASNGSHPIEPNRKRLQKLTLEFIHQGIVHAWSQNIDEETKSDSSHPSNLKLSLIDTKNQKQLTNQSESTAQSSQTSPNLIQDTDLVSSSTTEDIYADLQQIEDPQCKQLWENNYLEWIEFLVNEPSIWKAKSNSGKKDLIEKLLPELYSMGPYWIGVMIKELEVRIQNEIQPREIRKAYQNIDSLVLELSQEQVFAGLTKMSERLGRTKQFLLDKTGFYEEILAKRILKRTEEVIRQKEAQKEQNDFEQLALDLSQDDLFCAAILASELMERTRDFLVEKMGFYEDELGRKLRKRAVELRKLNQK